ncbi:hypothetical protein AK812_SmicGene46717, partial [Symbiodinium microadriaticum]
MELPGRVLRCHWWIAVLGGRDLLGPAEKNRVRKRGEDRTREKGRGDETKEEDERRRSREEDEEEEDEEEMWHEVEEEEEAE